MSKVGMLKLKDSEISYIIEGKIKGLIPLSPTDRSNLVYKARCNSCGCYKSSPSMDELLEKWVFKK